MGWGEDGETNPKGAGKQRWPEENIERAGKEQKRGGRAPWQCSHALYASNTPKAGLLHLIRVTLQFVSFIHPINLLHYLPMYICMEMPRALKYACLRLYKANIVMEIIFSNVVMWRGIREGFLSC